MHGKVQRVGGSIINVRSYWLVYYCCLRAWYRVEPERRACCAAVGGSGLVSEPTVTSHDTQPRDSPRMRPHTHIHTTLVHARDRQCASYANLVSYMQVLEVRCAEQTKLKVMFISLIKFWLNEMRVIVVLEQFGDGCQKTMACYCC